MVGDHPHPYCHVSCVIIVQVLRCYGCSFIVMYKDTIIADAMCPFQRCSLHLRRSGCVMGPITGAELHTVSSLHFDQWWPFVIVSICINKLL